MNLNGKTILITRASAQAEALVRLVEENGGVALLFPTIEIAPPVSWEECDRAIDRLPEYDCLIFTSANGAEFFLLRYKKRELPCKNLRGKLVLAVGEKTKKACERHGLPVTCMPAKYTSDGMRDLISIRSLKGKRCLFIKGNLAGKTIPAALRRSGASVDEVIVYQTKMPEPKDTGHIRDLIRDLKIDVITFTSPSTVKNFFKLTGKKSLPDRIKIAAIGSATAGAAAELGLRVDMLPDYPTAESLIGAILDGCKTDR